jgi:phage terminase large subunit-like protein
VALVAPTAADARDVMVEGESGILAISSEAERPTYEPSKRRLTWANGAVGTTFSADEPERLRGPQHDAAWCDELGAWRYPEAWDMPSSASACSRAATERLKDEVPVFAERHLIKCRTADGALRWT